jgi:group II intron reverse transcriptase/maturase
MRIRRGSYHPKPSRIVEIPKTDGSMRPLAISCYEDKIVQEALRRILERIYEPIFLKNSHGFRPGRGCDTALVALNDRLKSADCGAVLEIDLRKYFNTIPHEPLIRLMRLKIKDERFLHLVIKLLKAPTQDKGGKVRRNEMGSPQGSILSPLLANLYLHYVMDIWFSWINESKFGGSAALVRYADDGVFTFRTLKEATEFRIELAQRLNSFGISLNEDKTVALACGPQAAAQRERKGLKMPCFTFLGFLHVWGKSWNRKRGFSFWRVKRRTCPKRFRKKLAEITSYIKKRRHDKNLLGRVKRIVQGYANYFAINDNGKRIGQFLNEVRRQLFKWLNRRSQRRSFTWDEFLLVLEKAKFPQKVPLRNLFFNLKTSGNSP